MITILSVTFVHAVEACVVAVLLGAIASYLVLRNNPKYKARLDAETSKVSKKK